MVSVYLKKTNYTKNYKFSFAGKSLMERLMELPVYQKNPLTRTYDKRMITKLIYNFRSHSKIIELPNKAFYDGDLVAKATSGNTFFSYFCTDRPFLRILN
jgi:hypothetical protein